MAVYGGVPVIIHADDYGETYNTCTEMIELLKGGYLDGISLITNMRDYERYADMFYKAIPGFKFLPLVNIHINLVEGRSLDGECLKWDWMSLFKVSYHLPASDTEGEPMRYKAVSEELTDQIRAQIIKGREFIDNCRRIAEENGIPYTPQEIRLDAHQHAHMIPIVWKAVKRVITSEGLNISYIRNSHEPLTPFFGHKRCRSMKGIMKNRILAFCAPPVERYIRSHVGTPSYLCGVMMSGHMDVVRLMEVMPKMLNRCRKKGYGLEINIHPAMMLETEATEEIPMDAARSFYMSTDRHTEALTVRTIRAAMENTFNTKQE